MVLGSSQIGVFKKRQLFKAKIALQDGFSMAPLSRTQLKLMKYCFFSFLLRFRRNTSKTCGFCARFAETTRKRNVSGSFASNFIQTLLFILFRRNRARNDNKNCCLSNNVAQTLAIYTVSEHPNVARARNSIKTYRFRSKVAETTVIYTVSE